MKPTRRYLIAQTLRVTCAQLGVSTERILARCGLPRDYLDHETRGVDARTWFAMAAAFEQEVDDPDLPLTLGREAARGPLQPALLAFACSPDIATGLERLKLFKPLVVPCDIVIDHNAERFSVRLLPSEPGIKVPPVTAAFEIAFFVAIMRNFTAHEVKPLVIGMPDPGYATDAFHAFVGAPIEQKPLAQFVLSTEDAHRPLVSADTDFYEVIERELLARLDLDKATATRERVQRELIELLPSGRVSIEAVCDRLRTSKRSLQRRLRSEETTFQSVLDETRAELALTYLRDQRLSVEETSYLLAYRDPNSFYRAFQDWTGMTPGQARLAPAG